jgi:uncharacterized protein
MVGLGTLINVFLILAGSLLGLWVGHLLAPNFRVLITDVLGLVTGIGAVSAAAQINNSDLVSAIGPSAPILVVLASLLVGGGIGYWLRIEEKLDSLGQKIQSRYSKGDGDNFVLGFVSASLLFCIGPLAILGAFDDALGLGIDKLVLKSTLDFFAAIAFAASFGWGVALSALAVGLYQGFLTVIGLLLGSIWDEAQIAAMSAVGGLMLMGISLKLLNLKHIAIGNLLPALFVAPLFVWLITVFN